MESYGHCYSFGKLHAASVRGDIHLSCQHALGLVVNMQWHYTVYHYHGDLLQGLSEPLGALMALLSIKPFLTPMRLQYMLAFVGGVMVRQTCSLLVGPKALPKACLALA